MSSAYEKMNLRRSVRTISANIFNFFGQRPGAVFKSIMEVTLPLLGLLTGARKKGEKLKALVFSFPVPAFVPIKFIVSVASTSKQKEERRSITHFMTYREIIVHIILHVLAVYVVVA